MWHSGITTLAKLPPHLLHSESLDELTASAPLVPLPEAEFAVDPLYTASLAVADGAMVDSGLVIAVLINVAIGERIHFVEFNGDEGNLAYFTASEIQHHMRKGTIQEPQGAFRISRAP